MDANVRRSQTDSTSGCGQRWRQHCLTSRTISQCAETGANGDEVARGRALLGRRGDRYLRGTLRQGGRPQRLIFRDTQDEVTNWGLQRGAAGDDPPTAPFASLTT